MSDATYTDPSDSNKDQVRLLVGDTDMEDALMLDNEIEFFIANEASVYLAAAATAEAMAAKVAREVSNSLEQGSAQLSDQYKNYKQLARQLRIDAQKFGDKEVIRTGGVTSTGTARDPIFSIGMDDNLGVGNSIEGQLTQTP